MTRRPLGEICIELGLLRPEQVDFILRADLDTRLFGERARRLGLLDDESIARALAHQAQINLVPGDRLTRLPFAPEVLTLLPPSLVRDRLMLPTFLDPETRVLSMLVADPTDRVALRAAQSAAGAARVRPFVVARSALVALIDRVLPATPGRTPDVPAPALAPRDDTSNVDDAQSQPTVVVFEPDLARARALRLLAEAEDAPVEIVTDPALVGPFIDAGEAASVVCRSAIADGIAALVPGWQRSRSGLSVRRVEDHGPHVRAPLDWDSMRACLVAIAGEHGRDGDPGVRAAFLRLLDALTGHATPPPGTYTLLREMVAGVVARDADDIALLEDAADFARRLALPWGTAEATRAIAARLRGEAGPGEDALVEACFTAIVAWRSGIVPPDAPPAGDDDADTAPIEALILALGDGAARHDARTLRALARVLPR